MQVVRHIRDEVLSGRLAQGDLVPSARQIAADWHIALATATKALATLRAEGLVRGVPGVGTVVTSQESLHRSARDRSITIRRTGRVYPPGHYARIRSAELTTAPDTVAEALGVEPGVPVIRRRRTTYDSSDTPLSTSVSWFDGDLAATCPDLLVAERLPQGTSRYIEAQTGRAAATGYDRLAAGTANAQDAAELHSEVGSSVLLGQNRWADVSGRVVEYGESVSLPGRWTFYEYAIEGSNE
jgi:DNA-binding GntR family transcriptional regulator